MSDIGERNRMEMRRRVERQAEAGWGAPDPYSVSPEERAAWEYVEKKPLVESGQLSLAELPEEYGGRPTGTTRRAIRQQLAWDAGYAAELERQKQMREIEEFNKSMRLQDLEIQTQQMNLQSKKEEALFEKQTQAEQSSQFLGYQQFVNTLVEQKLNPFDAYAAVTDYLSDNPQLANNPLVQKSVYYFEQNAAAEKKRMDNSSAKIVDTVVSDALRAGMTEEDVEKYRDVDDQGNEIFNVVGLKKATDIMIGKRKVAEEERKQEPTEEEKQAALEKSTETRSRASLVKAFEQKSVEAAADIARLQKLVDRGDKKSQPLLEAKLAEKAVYDSKIQEYSGESSESTQPQTTGQKRTARDIFGD